MTTIFKLAWRNIWRNKRRTYITLASIFFAVLLSAFMVAFQKGAWDRMIDNVVGYYYGYAQVHEKGYWSEQSIDKAFAIPSELETVQKEMPDIRIVPRIESFALASHENNTTGVMVVGTDPVAEDSMTRLSTRLTSGRYFVPGEEAALIAEGIAKNMKLGVGDTLVLISQGYHGVNAAGKYPIIGILNFPSPDLNKRMVYLPLKVAQYFYGAENLVTTVALNLENKDVVPPTIRALKKELPSGEFEVMDWKQLMPDLMKAREADTAGAYLMLFVLYVIISFGIYGTILMMTKEREFEFGVLVSIGMKRLKLGISIWVEIILLGILGSILGILGAIPLVYYFHVNPVDFSNMGEGSMDVFAKWGFDPIFPTAFEPAVFTAQALVVFIITAVLAFYPLLKITRLKPVEAMRA
ncbi:MAG: ABC transporter permease [Lewinellaceae bacterium]|nr:ABC transporter permease [Lewinellaceae bacterium]